MFHSFGDVQKALKNKQQYVHFILFLYVPFIELQVQPLKKTYSNRCLEHDKSFWTFVEQEMYNITGPFFW